MILLQEKKGEGNNFFVRIKFSSRRRNLKKFVLPILTVFDKLENLKKLLMIIALIRMMMMIIMMVMTMSLNTSLTREGFVSFTLWATNFSVEVASMPDGYRLEGLKVRRGVYLCSNRNMYFPMVLDRRVYHLLLKRVLLLVAVKASYRRKYSANRGYLFLAVLVSFCTDDFETIF